MTEVVSAADMWWPVLLQARWFQGKGRGGRLTSVVPLPWYAPPGAGTCAVRPEIATVEYPDGSSERYQLLVSYRSADDPSAADSLVGTLRTGDGVLRVHDAPRDPEAMAIVVAALLRPGQTSGDHARVTIRLPRPWIGTPDLTPVWYPGEQSNTNVVLGKQALLKLFRKLEPGANLDIEVHDLLLRAGVTTVATLHGWVEAHVQAPDGSETERLDLAMLVQLLPQPQDGWVLAVASCRDDTDFTADAAALGAALREIHQALSGEVATLDGGEVADRMVARLRAATLEAPQLAEHADGLRQRFDQLRGLRLAAQRIHGDFHLGQTLKTGLGWRIIDFEGEPLKPMAERRALDTPWRDVAGMLRSLSYATSGHADPGSPEAAAWLTRTQAAFLNAYCGGLAGADAAVLAAYEADKAVYEVLYEIRNRPGWVHIPLRALASLAEPA